MNLDMAASHMTNSQKGDLNGICFSGVVVGDFNAVQIKDVSFFLSTPIKIPEQIIPTVF